MPQNTQARHWTWSATLGLAMLIIAGCGGGSSTPAASTNVHTYHVRGIVMELPTPGAKDRELVVHHEAVPDFVDMTGKVVGMQSMTMPFTLAPGVTLDGIAVGDKVTLTLVMDWTRNSEQTTRVEKLPADTVLVLPAHAMTMGHAATATAPATAP